MANTEEYGIKAYAKVNVRLKITGRRADGYHDLVSIMVPIGHYDLLEMKVPFGKGIEIESEGFAVPADETNLVCRAVRSFMAKTGIGDGVFVRLIKNIPVAAGLGGGSSDAAAALLTLNKAYSRPLSGSDLHEIALNLGADVPFFLSCRPSLARGIGEILEPIKNWPDFCYVVVTPPISVSTKWVYKNLKLELTTGEYDYIVSILKNDTFSISCILDNDLEKVTSASFPIINTLKKLLKDAGAEGAVMSGSGPSVVGLFTSSEQAESARDLFIRRDLGNVFMARGVGTEELPFHQSSIGNDK